MGAVADLLTRYIGTGHGRVGQREAERLTEALDPSGKRKVPQSTISDILVGRTIEPDVETLNNLCEALGIDVGEMADASTIDRRAAFVAPLDPDQEILPLQQAVRGLSPEAKRRLAQFLRDNE